ncbi:uncharacterized protein LOC130672742 [Microplitis mediator]|uniref:uncharacterized protein LOC130672742 n=1 Tax=Microplitis mediator TaxID=375433 RepID=UPI002556BD21|nr:uncharacterized protein LOC130672742 [Microplitis mediator]
MNYFHISNLTIWILTIVIHLNMVSVISELVPIQKSDPREWQDNGAEANFLVFNSIYAVSIDEELLTVSGYSTGKCDQFEPSRKLIAADLPYPNKCPGIIHFCWFKAESERRQAAAKKKADLDCKFGCTNDGYNALIQASIDYNYVGNNCSCLCERYYNYKNNPRGDLIDSICYDPVSVDDGYVATGVRFKKHSNIVYLELQQGILSAGQIDPNTLKWTTANNCNLTKKVISDFRSNNLYESHDVILEDMTLPENAVVTGVTLGKSLRGRIINDDGDFNDDMDEIVKSSQCDESTTDFLQTYSNLPSTSLIGRNTELSKSCEHRIVFISTGASSDYMQHVVPYVDLQEIVTDQKSPEPLRGIGWYYRGYPGYGGYLALKIFK